MTIYILCYGGYDECYALEDSKNGLLSAYRAGCKPIMVPDLWQPDEEILEVIVGKYSDLDEASNDDLTKVL